MTAAVCSLPEAQPHRPLWHGTCSRPWLLFPGTNEEGKTKVLILLFPPVLKLPRRLRPSGWCGLGLRFSAGSRLQAVSLCGWVAGVGSALLEVDGIPDGQGPGRHFCGARSLCWVGAAGGPWCSEAALQGLQARLGCTWQELIPRAGPVSPAPIPSQGMTRFHIGEARSLGQTYGAWILGFSMPVGDCRPLRPSRSDGTRTTWRRPWFWTRPHPALSLRPCWCPATAQGPQLPAARALVSLLCTCWPPQLWTR